MELQQYVQVLRHYWRSVVATTLLLIIAAAGFTLVQKPTYTGSSIIFVHVQGGTAGELSQGANYAEQQVKSYVRVASSASVLQPVIDDLRLSTTPEQLNRQLSISSPTGTSVIQINASDADPQVAMELANAVANSLVQTIDTLSPTSQAVELVKATVVDPAVLPGTPTSPDPVRNLALGLVLGLLLGVGQAVLRNLLDTRVRTAEDLQAVTEAPLLGAIGHRGDPTDLSQSWSSAEAYRRLRTNVGFVGLGGERRPSIVITSANSGEGKTETVTNLAQMLARAGDEVLIVDADLRRPMIAARFGIDGDLGLTDFLTRGVELRDVLTTVEPGLDVLPAGTIPPNPSELLGSDVMQALIAWADRTYDYVLFDAPPLLPVTDAVVLGAATSGVIVVARHGHVRRPELQTAFTLLETGSVHTLGLVLNDVPNKTLGSYSGYYYNDTTGGTHVNRVGDAAKRGRVATRT